MIPILLLTACITPNSFDTLSITDPSTREKQYLEALNWYLHNTKYNIIFCDNSGYNISKYFESYIQSNRLEVITFTDPPELYDRGKGYKEMKIIEYIFKHSMFIRTTKNPIFIKITGRLIVRNINSIISIIKIINKKNFISCELSDKIDDTDSRFFIFSPSFYKTFITYKEDIQINFSFEKALLYAIKEYKKCKSGHFIYLPYPARIKGYSGGFGVRYKDDLKNFIIKLISFSIKRIRYIIFNKYKL